MSLAPTDPCSNLPFLSSCIFRQISSLLLRNALRLLLRIPCNMTSYFSLVVFKIPSMSAASDSLSIMCLGVSLWVYPTWNSLSICISIAKSSLRFRSFSAISSSNNHPAPFLLSLPSENPIMHILVHLLMSHISLRFCSLFFAFFFFLLLKLSNFKRPVLSLSSTFSSILLSPYSEFFNKLLYFAAPEFLSFFHNLFALCSHFVHVSLSSFPLVP